MNPSFDDLRRIPEFADLNDDQLGWLASHMEYRVHEPGHIMGHEGDPADHMIVVLEGELRGQRENGHSDGRTFTVGPGSITGMLPYSRLVNYPVTVRAVTPMRLAALHKDLFEEMLATIPVLQPRLVRVMADRIRENAAVDHQREKMTALGKLSAGLAHELNNPAAAAQRAACSLKEAVEALRVANGRLDELELSPEQRRFLAHMEQETEERTAGEVLDSLERSDREERIADWLSSRNIARAWEVAAALVDSGLEIDCLNEVAGQIPPEALEPALTRFAASSAVIRLVSEIENSTTRISELVKAVKEYSYMDRMPEQEVDIHAAIESTLLILKHRWKNGVQITREYDRSIPRICAKGSELNQVWTNLLDNAIDAMNGSGTICIRTRREVNNVIVDIIDSGPGIPKDVQAHIFDPFFTTKGVGDGTGLGLDTVYRIVRAHRGEVKLAESEPGNTRFEVRLPIPRAAQA